MTLTPIHVDAEVLLEAYEIFVALSGADNPRPQDTARKVADLYAAWAKPDKAAEWKDKLQEN